MPKKFISKNFFKIAVIFIGIILIVIWNPRSFFDKAEGVFLSATYPLQKIFANSADKISSFSETISSIGKLKKENEALLYENLRLKAENSRLKDVSTENDILRRELNLLPKNKFDLVSAHIVGRDFYENSDWALIDKGSKDGIKKGLSVIVGGGVLVGRIEKVFAHNSKIIAITNPDSNINAETVETGAIGIVKSEYGMGAVLDMVLQTDYLKVGDAVITSEISQNIPRGLLVGKIEEVHSSDDKLFQKAVLSLPIDFSKLRFVFVIKN